MWLDNLQTIRNKFQRGFKYWFVSIRMEKRKHLFLSIKKVISNSLKSAALFHCSQFVEDFLKDSFLMKCLVFYLKITLFYQINLDSNEEILALEASSQIFQKSLIGYGTNDIFKPSQNSTSGNLLDILWNFLSNRKQRVVINGQKSTWENVTAVFQQGSILGPLLFLIYINDLSGDLSSKTKLFADDTIFLMWRRT